MRFLFVSALVAWCIAVCAVDAWTDLSLAVMSVSTAVMAGTWRSMVRDGES